MTSYWYWWRSSTVRKTYDMRATSFKFTPGLALPEFHWAHPNPCFFELKGTLFPDRRKTTALRDHTGTSLNVYSLGMILYWYGWWRWAVMSDHNITHYRPAVPFGNSKFYFRRSFSSVLSKFKKYLPYGNPKFNNLGIFQSLKLRNLMRKILRISLKLNITSNTLGCKRLIWQLFRATSTRALMISGQ